MFLSSAGLKLLDAVFGPVLCLLLTRPNGHEVPIPDRVARILVLRPGGMGDMLLLLPMIDALIARYPEATIDLLCERRNAEVVTISRRRAEVLLYDVNPFKALRHLRRESYDLAIDTEQFHHFSAVLAFLSKAPLRIGFKINPRRNPLYTHLVNYAPDGPEASQFLRLLEPLSVPVPQGAISELTTRTLATAVRAAPFSIGTAGQYPPVPAEDARQSAAPPPRYAVIHPGATTRYKEWPLERFVALGERITKDLGMAIVFVGGSRDSAAAIQADTALRAMGCPQTRAFCGRSLPDTTDLVRGAALFVGADSGLAHLASAAGTPTVVLFGPSDSHKWGVTDARHKVISKALPCSPCFIFGYHRPCRHIACMQRIETDEVFSACKALISA
ncbi:MAG: glycosyltransferase family 9 protein [Lentisphaerae bacterium]|nr:glycosyltransferase family 9 protein [Lentisphaerota bacterium]